MKKFLAATFFLIALVSTSAAQTSKTGRIDQGPLAARPATCAPDDVWGQTDSPYTLYSCGPANTWTAIGTASGTAFSGLTGGTNSSAAMVVGTGASLGVSGSGTVTATGTASAPTNCSSGNAATGIGSNFAAQGCFNPISTLLGGNILYATVLASNAGQTLHADGKIDNSATCTSSNGSHTLVCTDAPFVSGDVGKAIQGISGISYIIPLTTISAFTSSTTVTLTGTASSNAAMTVIWNTADDAALQAVDTAYSAALAKGQVCLIMPDGISIVGHGYFNLYSYPTPFELQAYGQCISSASPGNYVMVPASNYNWMFHGAGETIQFYSTAQGTGYGPSNRPSFLFGLYIDGLGATDSTGWQNFGGGGQEVVFWGQAQIYHSGVLNWGANHASLTGCEINNNSTFYDLTCENVGTKPADINGGGVISVHGGEFGTVNANNSHVLSISGGTIVDTYGVEFEGCDIDDVDVAGTGDVWNSSGDILSSGGGQACRAANVVVRAGGQANINGTTITGSTSIPVIQTQAASARVMVSNGSTLTASGATIYAEDSHTNGGLILDDGTTALTGKTDAIQPSVFAIANASSTGTTLNKLAKLTGAPSTAVITTAGDTSGSVGIVTAGAGTSGNAYITANGLGFCVFDGATTAGHFVQQSASVAGDCTDGGASVPTIETFGRVLSTNGGGGTYQVAISLTDGATGAGSVTNFTSGNITGLFTTSVATATTTPALSFSPSTFCSYCFWGNASALSLPATPAQVPFAGLTGTATEAQLPAATVFTDQNATFGAHTYDFTGSTLTKLRTSAGATTSVIGDIAFDSTANNWHCYNTADRICAVFEGSLTSGDAVKVVSSGGRVSLQDAGGAAVTQAAAPAAFAGITTAANTPGVPVIVGYAAQTAQTMNISATTLFATGASNTLYRFSADVDCTTTSAAAVVTVSVKFTDTSNTVQTVASGNAACTALGSSSLASFVYILQAKASTNIQYLTTITNTPTYDVRAAVEQIGTN